MKRSRSIVSGGGVWTKPSYRWHEHYKSVNGKFDARYLPCDVFYLDVLPKLSNLKLAAAWEDKSYYSERFPDIPFPKILYACIDDQICDSHLSPCSYKDVWETVVNKQSVFVKPSLGSYQGIGSFILSAVDIGDLDFVEALSRTGSNYVIQELIHQHDFFAELNQDSVNIIRINTLNLGQGPTLLNATVRFGISGRVTDMCYVDGVETVRVAGITGDGYLRKEFAWQDGRRSALTTIGFSRGGNKVPGFDEALELCYSLHNRMLHFGLCAFDVAITKDGSPIVVEVNLGGPGVVFYQYAHGPFFGEQTGEVITYCLSTKAR